jgi:glycosyltransferase involved in cell wall biosynthesis
MNSVAFVTTSKGRLHHVKQTLPLIAAQNPDEIIVVDYGCPDGTSAWVKCNFPAVKVVRVNDDPGFCLSRARNIGAARSLSELICFIDADIKIGAGLIPWIKTSARSDAVYRAGLVNGRPNFETFGTAIIPRKIFVSIGGYDEVFRGWGGEDTDIYNRLRMSGVPSLAYLPTFVSPISHGDDERTKFSALPGKPLNFLVNRAYMKAKYQVMAMNNMRPPAFEDLDKVYKIIRGRIAQWDPKTSEDSIMFNFGFGVVDKLPGPGHVSYEFEQKTTFNIEIKNMREIYAQSVR